jgi:LmbE family N-acetylglucosaminyl deacetylase
VTHVFVSPHPDDAALSCGGLITSLRDRGEAVAIVSVFSGAGDLGSLTPFQRLVLGFGSQEKARVGDTDLLPEADDSGAVAIAAADAMAVRRAEDEAFARLVGAATVFVDLADAVFRGYGGDSQLMARRVRTTRRPWRNCGAPLPGWGRIPCTCRWG